MPAIIFFQHLKDTIHLCSTFFVFHITINFITFFFEGNMSLYCGNFFFLYVISKSFIMLSLVVIFFSFILFGISFFKSVSYFFTSSRLFLFTVSSNMLLLLILCPYILYFQLHISQSFLLHFMARLYSFYIYSISFALYFQLGYLLIFCLLDYKLSLLMCSFCY